MKEKYPPPKETVWKKWFDSFQEGDLVWFDYDDRWYIPHEDWVDERETIRMALPIIKKEFRKDRTDLVRYILWVDGKYKWNDENEIVTTDEERENYPVTIRDNTKKIKT